MWFSLDQIEAVYIAPFTREKYQNTEMCKHFKRRQPENIRQLKVRTISGFFDSKNAIFLMNIQYKRN